jgi:NIPSNAP
MNMRIATCVVSIVMFAALTVNAQTTIPVVEKSKTMSTVPTNFQVVEFRRYTVRDGEREHFTQYFEALFPEAFQQLGAIAFGDFTERDNPAHFTWMRGFHDMDERAKVNSAFYYGPVWKEHKATLNDLMTDSDNVLLLRPLRLDTEIPVLPAVDPVRETSGAQGVVIAQIFAVKPDQVDTFASAANAEFERYRTAGARSAGILVTLDAKNNFPQLPVRTDGPFLVWLGIFPDEQTAGTKFFPIAEKSTSTLQATGMLRNSPELVVLKPNPRSRLRWLPSSTF